MVSKNTEDYILQFISKDFQYLTQQKKFEYKGINLKSSYLIHIIHELLVKYYFSNNVDVKFNLSSVILKKKYGENYNHYIEYLCDNGFISLVSKYYVGKKTNSYKIVTKNIYDIIRWKNYDKILIKKNIYKNETNIADNQNNIIDIDIKDKLIKCLNNVNIDYKSSLEYINELREKDIINDSKYQSNLISIESINAKNIYFNFDNYGRFHSNFTILKKEIRNKYLTINNEILCEVDIKNSQPLFFAVLIKKSIEHINSDTNRYLELVKSGLLYDDIIANSKLECRNDAKEFIYKVLFGNNINSNKKLNKIFKDLYPTVYEYILEYKENRKNYKELSHELQRMESDFIFNNVVKEIFETYPEIVLFTVHDSILFPMSYKSRVEHIFNKHFQNLINIF
jgi:hypothetical protein